MLQWERAQHIGSVFQDPKSQFFSSELRGEIAFACENYGMNTGIVRVRTDAAIHDMKLTHLIETPIDRLSNGEKQKTAIASVNVLKPEVYVFDEPSANLDNEATEHLAQIIKQLKAQGHTLIIAEHRLHYLTDIADRFLYLENGRLTKSFTKEDLLALPEAIRLKMGIRSPQKIDWPELPRAEVANDKIFSLKLENITYSLKKKDILNSVSVAACPGHIVAITGKNGIGKTTLAKIMCGLLKESSGKVFIMGNQVGVKHRWKYAWYSANDTNTQFFTESIVKELLLLSVSTGAIKKHARNVLKEFSLYEYKDRHPFTLSGGEKQRLSIACGLLSNRDIMILDEPTSGLDGRNMQIVSNALKYAAAQGKTIFVITHDVELIAKACDYYLNL
jgi:energy-coupling factor transport system ATP-binding protein